MRVDSFGECDRGPVQVITLGSAPGPELEVLDLGASAHALRVTCGDGVRRNVLLGHPTAQDYRESTHYFGGTIGRYANRIAGGRFQLDGQDVQVGVHDRGNSLHGGPEGFDTRIWQVADGDGDRLVLRLLSEDGDQGFPGRVEAQVTYTVTPTGVRIEHQATTDATTVVNLTNHSYVNLHGEGSGTVEDHVLVVEADEYLPVDAAGIPVDGLHPVEGTPLDFRMPAPLRAAMRSGDEQVVLCRGIDHNVVPVGEGMRRVAVLDAPRTATRMELFSDQPGLQVYTGNFLDGAVPATSGGVYRQGDGIALEPQLFPDSPHHPEFASPVLRPGETYRSRLEWRFGQRP